MNRRRFLIVGGSAGIVLATAGAVYSAGRARTPTQRAAQAAPPSPSTVTAPVRRGQLSDETVLDGQLARADETDVAAPTAVAGAARLVVTKVIATVGREVNAGDVLLEVSGRPVIVLNGAFPAFRDLKRGDRGPDVKQLQQALRSRYGTPRTSVFDDRTERDLRRLYQRAGYLVMTVQAPPSNVPSPSATTQPTLHEQVVLPVGEVAFVPTLPAWVGSMPAKVGAAAAGTMATLASGAWRVVVAVDPDADMALKVTGVELILGEGPLRGSKTTLVASRQTPGESGQSQTKEALFSVPKGAPLLTAGDQQQVRVIRARSPQNSLIVPVAALWTAADGSVHVTVIQDGQRRDVAVAVGLSVLGEAAVTGDLTGTDRVVVVDHG